MHKTGIDTVEEFWSWADVETALSRANASSPARFISLMKEYLGVDHLAMAQSARLGLQWILQGCAGKRSIVLLPAFNCTAVADAVWAAGLTPRCFDFAGRPGQFNWDALTKELNRDCAAVIVPHYFGIPQDFRPILTHCRELGIIVIEDCAHALSAKIEGATVGTIGDASVFSFNYDKPISLGWGGAVCINRPELRDRLNIPAQPIPTLDWELARLKAFVQNMQRRRHQISSRYTLGGRITRKLRLTRAASFAIPDGFGIGPLRSELGILSLQNYPEIVEQRNRNARHVIKSARTYKTWPITENVTPAYLKLKVTLSPSNQWSKVSAHLQRQGLRVGNFNWPELVGSVSPEDFPLSAEAARHWIDVPTHQGLTDATLHLIIEQLNG